MLNGPVPSITELLSNIGHIQYLDGWPLQMGESFLGLAGAAPMLYHTERPGSRACISLVENWAMETNPFLATFNCFYSIKIIKNPPWQTATLETLSLVLFNINAVNISSHYNLASICTWYSSTEVRTKDLIGNADIETRDAHHCTRWKVTSIFLRTVHSWIWGARGKIRSKTFKLLRIPFFADVWIPSTNSWIRSVFANNHFHRIYYLTSFTKISPYELTHYFALHWLSCQFVLSLRRKWEKFWKNPESSSLLLNRGEIYRMALEICRNLHTFMYFLPTILPCSEIPTIFFITQKGEFECFWARKEITIGVRMCQFFSRGQKVPRFITYVSWSQLTYVMNLGTFCPLEKN
jgi:hypothetical protein